ncbi:HyaD/HybD family hydrogenase maturation endopeptidase [Desulfovibrio sp. PG-178-WT-4]|uniref:HyaD/HybD family hydrogenase maturation endopeptidase n=1 Tax=Desulfovibrio porci TaxID=2605782 RepID=A0A6L5XH78_9BACT|nr:HyaD/HybD family hydrogenase maturation endopeptidase [Desulfovibrio porci]MSS26534.1 HyaD/HybD family hydrogenase maturation endopeptidase [Desulfovibrio porci]
MDDKKILILGVGNILLTDEGFGVRAVEYLETHYRWPERVRLMDGGTQGLMLMPELLECDFLVVLDVVLGPEAPGTVYLLEGEDLRKSLSFRDSMHQTDLLDTLITCHLAGHRPEAVIIGLQPFDYKTMQVGLSPQAQALLPEFCRKAVEEMARRGIVAEARTDQC